MTVVRPRTPTARIVVALGFLVPLVTASCEDVTGPKAASELPARLVVSASYVDGRGSGVFSVGVDGSSLRQISEPISDIDIARNLAVSPSGDRIALDVFEQAEDGSYTRNIYVLDPAGEARRLTDSRTQDRSPTWSPDGSRIAYASFGNTPSGVYVMEADGTGERLAYIFRPSDGRDGLFVMDADGLDVVEVPIPGSPVLVSVDWMP